MIILTNQTSGMTIGSFDAATKAEALEMYAKDAGYKSFRDMCNNPIEDPDDLDAAAHAAAADIIAQ